MSLAKKHRQNVQRQAAIQNVQVHPEKLPIGSNDDDYALLAAALELDLNRLSEIQSREKRAEVKRDELLPKYLPHVERFFSNEPDYQNDIAAYCIIWLFDTGQIEKALALTDAGLTLGLALPEPFSRPLQSLAANEVAEWSLTQLNHEHSPEPYLQQTFDAGWDIPDPVQAKLHKALGLWLEKDQPEAALEHFEAALQLDDTSGVKNMIKRVTKQLET